jgi:hypothetical protein
MSRGALLDGLQLISVGINGVFLRRIQDEVKARPLCVVSETFGLDDEE